MTGRYGDAENRFPGGLIAAFSASALRWRNSETRKSSDAASARAKEAA
jgi:hypothetical protein